MAIYAKKKAKSPSACFAMTINKCQAGPGQSLNTIGLYLPKQIFYYGQLYVVLSRVTHRKRLKVVMGDSKCQGQNEAKNIVYKENF